MKKRGAWFVMAIVDATLLVCGQLGNAEKARDWFTSANPLLGGVSPVDMILLGRTGALLDFIKGQLAENAPPLGDRL